MLEDTPLTPEPTEEELAAEQAAIEDELLARRIRREVKRMESGEAADDLERDAEEDAAESERRADEEAQREAERAKQAKRYNGLFWLMISGSILQKEYVSKYYSQMVIIAVLFFTSIFVMFWSLHLDMRYNQTMRDVQLLRERSARLQELRYSKCSHTAIAAELKRRGLTLDDPTHPAMVIEKSSWFGGFK